MTFCIILLLKSWSPFVSAQAFLTINPSAFKDEHKRLVFRQVEVGWFGLEGDVASVRVALYGEDPEVNATRFVLEKQY